MFDHFLSRNIYLDFNVTSNLHTHKQLHLTVMSTITLANTGSTTRLFRHYETRNNSIAHPNPHPVTQLTGGNHDVEKPKITLKSPALQLVKTECATGSKTTSTPIQEAQKDNSKPLQAAAVIAGNPSSESNPLYDSDDSDDCDDGDSLQHSIHYHRLTSSMFHET